MTNSSPNLSGPAAAYILRHIERRFMIWAVVAWGLGVCFGISLCFVLVSLYL